MNVQAAALVMLAQCDRNLRYRYVNQTYAETFGLRAEEIVGRQIREVLGDAAIGLILPRIDAVLQGNVVEFEAEIPFSRIGPRWMRVIYAPLFDDDGTVSGWSACISPSNQPPVTAGPKSLGQVEERTSTPDSPEALPTRSSPVQLHEFLTAHRGELTSRCRAKVASRSSPPSTEAELHGVPLFLEQLIEALKFHRGDSSDIGTSAGKHGQELLRRGFTVAQVVRDYGDVCQAVTELAVELKAPIAADDFQVLTQCLDNAVADAVTAYAKQLERLSDVDEAQRLGSLAHEMRNLVNAAILTFEVLKTGNVDVGGSSGAALERSLLRMKELVSTTLTDVQLEAGSRMAEETTIADAIDDIVTTAFIEAKAFPIHLVVEPVRSAAVVSVDRQILSAAITNLLHNAFKFTREGGRVVLRTRATADRVLFEVEDECGGLKVDPETLFRPFEQFNTDRSGVGLGLSIAHRGITTMNGAIHLQDKPGIGCVFTVDLPRVVPHQATAF